MSSTDGPVYELHIDDDDEVMRNIEQELGARARRPTTSYREASLTLRTPGVRVTKDWPLDDFEQLLWRDGIVATVLEARANSWKATGMSADRAKEWISALGPYGYDMAEEAGFYEQVGIDPWMPYAVIYIQGRPIRLWEFLCRTPDPEKHGPKLAQMLREKYPDSVLPASFSSSVSPFTRSGLSSLSRRRSPFTKRDGF